MYCIFQMSKQLFSVNDALEYIEELDVQLLEDVDTIDVVELPPEKVDSVSDEEEFADEEELGFGESQVVSVPGFVEVSCNALDLVPTASEDSPTAQENTLQNIVDGAESGVVDPTEQQLSKKRKTSVSAKQRSKNATTQVAWNVTKNKPDCSITSNVYDPSPARENLIALHGDKTKFEIFSLMTKGVYDIMAEQSLTYAQQNNYLDFNCSVEDYMAFTGILMAKQKKNTGRKAKEMQSLQSKCAEAMPHLQCRISCRLLQCIPQAILALYRLFTNTVTFRQVYFQNVFSFKSQNQSF